MEQGFAQGIQLIDVDAPLTLFGWSIRGGTSYRLGAWLHTFAEQTVDPEVPIQHAQIFFQDYVDKPVFAAAESNTRSFDCERLQGNR